MTQLIFRVKLVNSIKKIKKSINRFLLLSHHKKNQNFQRNKRFIYKGKHSWICDSRTSLKKTNPWKFETNLWHFQKPLKREKSTNGETQLKIYLLEYIWALEECFWVHHCSKTCISLVHHSILVFLYHLSLKFLY